MHQSGKMVFQVPSMWERQTHNFANSADWQQSRIWVLIPPWPTNRNGVHSARMSSIILEYLTWPSYKGIVVGLIFFHGICAALGYLQMRDEVFSTTTQPFGLSKPNTTNQFHSRTPPLSGLHSLQYHLGRWWSDKGTGLGPAWHSYIDQDVSSVQHQAPNSSMLCIPTDSSEMEQEEGVEQPCGEYPLADVSICLDPSDIDEASKISRMVKPLCTPIRYNQWESLRMSAFRILFCQDWLLNEVRETVNIVRKQT